MPSILEETEVMNLEPGRGLNPNADTKRGAEIDELLRVKSQRRIGDSKLPCPSCGVAVEMTINRCPFCESDTQKLMTLAIEGESGLRVDYCESCQGYLKTYAGQGDEAVLLADWTSLHLDLLARDRGLKRLAASLYDLDGAA